MLDKKKIEKLVNESVEGSDRFLVEVSVSSANVVDVFVDGDNGISIKECVKISRLIESTFDREIEDYELRVSSPGLSRPFKMIRQYKKYIDREIIIVTNEGDKIKGVLKSVSENGIDLELKKGKKGKEIILEEFLFDGIKESKPYVGF